MHPCSCSYHPSESPIFSFPCNCHLSESPIHQEPSHLSGREAAGNHTALHPCMPLSLSLQSRGRFPLCVLHSQSHLIRWIYERRPFPGEVAHLLPSGSLDALAGTAPRPHPRPGTGPQIPPQLQGLLPTTLHMVPSPTAHLPRVGCLLDSLKGTGPYIDARILPGAQPKAQHILNPHSTLPQARHGNKSPQLHLPTNT